MLLLLLPFLLLLPLPFLLLLLLFLLLLPAPRSTLPSTCPTHNLLQTRLGRACRRRPPSQL